MPLDINEHDRLLRIYARYSGVFAGMDFSSGTEARTQLAFDLGYLIGIALRFTVPPAAHTPTTDRGN